MKVHVLPLATLFVPNSGLFHRNGRRFAISDLLCQANIGDHRDVAHDANVRGDNGRLDGIRTAWEIKIVLMKIQSIDQIPHRLGLKTCQTRAAKVFVSIPVPPGNGDQESLGQIQDRIPIGRCGPRGNFLILPQLMLAATPSRPFNLGLLLGL